MTKRKGLQQLSQTSLAVWGPWQIVPDARSGCTASIKGWTGHMSKAKADNTCIAPQAVCSSCNFVLAWLAGPQRTLYHRSGTDQGKSTSQRPNVLTTEPRHPPPVWIVENTYLSPQTTCCEIMVFWHLIINWTMAGTILMLLAFYFSTCSFGPLNSSMCCDLVI